MLKGTVIWACVLTILSFTAASSKFEAKDLNSDSQFVLKSLAEFSQQAYLYEPLRIHTQTIEESFSDDEANKNLQSALATSAKIISDLLLTKPTNGKLTLSENNQCADIMLGQMIQSEDLSADITIFAVNNEEKAEITTSKICEVSEDKTIKSIVLEINAEKLMKLDELSQVKELCTAISKVLYEDKEVEKQMLLSEMAKFLSKEREIKIAPILGACAVGVGGCASCDTTNTNCLMCEATNYYPSGEICLACTPPCAECVGTETFCTTCYDAINMINNAGACICTDPNASFSTTSYTCVCNSGYSSIGGICIYCAAPCATCSAGNTCSSCYDETYMTLTGGVCTCRDLNASFSTTSNTCVCNAGYYSNAGICIDCAAPCATCSDANTCLSCDDAHMTLYEGTCSCDWGYYLNDGICTACVAPCSVCISADYCIGCEDPDHMALSSGTCICIDPNASFSTTSLTCVCNSGYSSVGGVCTACIAPCSTCQTSPYLCTSCDDAANMVLMGSDCVCTDINAYFNDESLTCQCKSSYFSNSGVCTHCDATCSTCSGSADFCTSCRDSAHMILTPDTGVCSCKDPNASFNEIIGRCQCNSGYISDLGFCDACVLPCATCSSSLTFCTSCEDPTNMYLNTVAGTCRCWDLYASFDQTSKTCQCIQGYYMSSSGTCQPCISPCAQCSNSATFCTACNDFANMNLNAITGTCTCKEPNYQFNPWVKACQSNSGCNCNQCGTIINNIINFNF
ncbi:unnamed protein product [Blepharisma stoltei]|uniref:EGF-like domain-containing protein n=1 Tax=Blepharisma stoltei TaxID=1481888 RepID=A0AAU9KDZ5_9CILI|nr:unnamed protein product [Blepharisma stoltei]